MYDEAQTTTFNVYTWDVNTNNFVIL